MGILAYNTPLASYTPPRVYGSSRTRRIPAARHPSKKCRRPPPRPPGTGVRRSSHAGAKSRGERSFNCQRARWLRRTRCAPAVHSPATVLRLRDRQIARSSGKASLPPSAARVPPSGRRVRLRRPGSGLGIGDPRLPRRDVHLGIGTFASRGAPPASRGTTPASSGRRGAAPGRTPASGWEVPPPEAKIRPPDRGPSHPAAGPPPRDRNIHVPPCASRLQRRESRLSRPEARLPRREAAESPPSSPLPSLLRPVSFTDFR